MILVIKARDPHKHTLHPVLRVPWIPHRGERQEEQGSCKTEERERKEGENEKEGGRGDIKGQDAGRENQSQKEKFETQTDMEPLSSI